MMLDLSIKVGFSGPLLAKNEKAKGAAGRGNHGEAVYIINSVRKCISSTRSVVYYQAEGEYTLMRDEITKAVFRL